MVHGKCEMCGKKTPNMSCNVCDRCTNLMYEMDIIIQSDLKTAKVIAKYIIEKIKKIEKENKK